MDVFLGIGIMTGIIVLCSAYARAIMHRAGAPSHGKLKARDVQPEDTGARSILELEKLKIQERKEARAMVERLVQAKLDVINNAVAMGASDKELAQLDARLEKLVGEERLKSLLEGKDLDSHDPDLHDTSLESELLRMKQGQGDK